jgi:hypothetical protein
VIELALRRIALTVVQDEGEKVLAQRVLNGRRILELEEPASVSFEGQGSGVQILDTHVHDSEGAEDELEKQNVEAEGEVVEEWWVQMRMKSIYLPQKERRSWGYFASRH